MKSKRIWTVFHPLGVETWRTEEMLQYRKRIGKGTGTFSTGRGTGKRSLKSASSGLSNRNPGIARIVFKCHTEWLLKEANGKR
jgi:hypothetical protein